MYSKFGLIDPGLGAYLRDEFFSEHINYNRNKIFFTTLNVEKINITLSVELKSQISFVFCVDELKTLMSLAVCPCRVRSRHQYKQRSRCLTLLL